MRIGFDAKRAFYNQSGLGNYSRTLISQLCFRFPENEYFLFSPGNKSVTGDFPPENSSLVIPAHFPFKQFPSAWRSIFMGNRIASEKIEVFHGLSNELPLNARKSKARLLVTIHDLIFLRYPELYKKADIIIYQNKFLQSCKLSDAIIAVSQQTKNDIIHYFSIDPGKIQVIYQGCNPVFYSKAEETTKVLIRQKYNLPHAYILYVGTMEERKNLLHLVRAKHEKNISLPLVVIGRSTPYFEKVREYISLHNIKNILFLKNIEQVELPAIYQMADVFVYPSSFEGFGIPILEALNSGTPVITGNGSCMPETGGPFSIYINPLDAGEIGDSINRVLNDQTLRNKMISEGYKHAMLFREEQTTNEMMKLYEQIIA